MEDLLDQTNAIAKKIYEDPLFPSSPFDIFTAVAVGNYDAVTSLIKQKVQLNRLNRGGWSPLMYAAYMGHDTIINLLLEASANPNFCTRKKLSPLMIAAGCGNESVCYFLLQHQALLNAQDTQGHTPLSYATRQGHHNCVRLLLESGAEMDVREFEQGLTPLMEATWEGHEIIVETLLACGANSKLENKDGHTARSLALKANHMMVVSLLDNAHYVHSYTEAWDESGDETLGESEGSDIMTGPKEFSRSYDPTQPSTDVLARRRSSVNVHRISSPQQTADTSESDKEQVKDVCPQLKDFLQPLDMDKYLGLFAAEEIDFETLLSCSEDMLKQIGIVAFGPRRRLMLAISKYKKEQGAPVDYNQAVTQLEEERRRRNSLEAGAARCRQVLGELATIVAADGVSGTDKITQITAKLQQVELDCKK